jgi:hypothetical protein
MCLPSHIVCSQTWLNHLINDHNLCYIANLKTIAQPFMHVHVFVLYFFIIFMNIQRIFGHDNFVPWQFEYMCLSCLDMLLVLTPMLGGYYFFGPNIYIYIICQIRIWHFYLFLNSNILVKYQIFTFKNLSQISIFLDICDLFITQISINLDIKHLKICLPIMLGASFYFVMIFFQKVTSIF